METQNETDPLDRRIAAFLDRRGIRNWLGPPRPYFDVIWQPGRTRAQDVVRRYTYESYDCRGVKKVGQPCAHASAYEELEDLTLDTLRIHTGSHRTLVWREKVQVGLEEDRWYSYMRFVQLEEDVESIMMIWPAAGELPDFRSSL